MSEYGTDHRIRKKLKLKNQRVSKDASSKQSMLKCSLHWTIELLDRATNETEANIYFNNRFEYFIILRHAKGLQLSSP